MRITLFGLFFLAALTIGGADVQAQCTAPTAADLAGYLKTHYQSPEEYVVGKFKDHDVVLLGEMHRIKHDPELIQKLIPLLHAAGVNALATEFARAEDQPLIDSLLGGNNYDEALAQKIAFNQMVTWAYREYVDIFKAAWELNHTLLEGAPRFRILGVNCSPDWSVMQKPEDRDVDSLKRLAWRGCGESNWAQNVLRYVAGGEKILVYCGMHHAFTRFLQPIVGSDGEFFRFEDERFGRYLYNRLGDRTFMIALHAPWLQVSYEGEYKRPAGGLMDSAVALIDGQFRPFGVDVVGTPLESIPDSVCVYANGHRPFRLGALCDGYIIQKRFADCETVTAIPDFINDTNLMQAQQQCASPSFRKSSVEEFRKSIEMELARWKLRLNRM